MKLQASFVTSLSLFLQKRMLKQALRGFDEIIDYSGQSALWETIDSTGASAQSSPCWALHLQGKQDGGIAPKSFPHPQGGKGWQEPEMERSLVPWWGWGR